jgi:hypothetical protein
MHRIAIVVSLLFLGGLTGAAQEQGPSAGQAAAEDNNAELRREVESLKKALAALEARLAAQEQGGQAKKAEASAEATKPPAEEAKPAVNVADLAAEVKELDERVSQTERGQAMDRLRFSGDYRFEVHNITGHVPSHFDGLTLQNLVVKTMFAMPILGRPPASVDEINRTVSSHYSQYQQFTSNLTFPQLKQAMGSFPAPMQQQLFGMLMPSTYVPGYSDDTNSLMTNRLRLRFDARVADNVTFTGRLSMYKVFGDSTGVQVFNGQPNTLNMDGTTVGVPNSDQLRVERAYFSWNKIGGSNLYLSVGRRPSTDGPPLNYRQDELRGGTPSGALIGFQFDGITAGYHLSDKMTWRLCYGLGYQSGFGNGNLLKTPQDRLKDVHLLGLNLDLWETESSLIQATYAHAFDVTDGFNGLMVLPRDPLTGESVPAPAVLRYTPSANLGSINLFGVNVERKMRSFDLYLSGNFSSTSPNGQTTPFGGLMSDPFDTPKGRTGYMGLMGLRYNFPNDERTKLGFEFNSGSKYWFNFSQAEDDIIAPKTNTRGNVYETYLTHRINDRFILKGDFIKYIYNFSGSGWHLGDPKPLNSNPILGFPAYKDAYKFSVGLITRF